MANNRHKEQSPHNIQEALLRFENSDKTAIICGNDKISYKELLADAKKVAHALIAKGVKKGNRVVFEYEPNH